MCIVLELVMHLKLVPAHLAEFLADMQRTHGFNLLRHADAGLHVGGVEHHGAGLGTVARAVCFHAHGLQLLKEYTRLDSK